MLTACSTGDFSYQPAYQQHCRNQPGHRGEGKAVEQWSSGAVEQRKQRWRHARWHKWAQPSQLGWRGSDDPVIVHPGTLAEHVLSLIVSSFLDSASISRNPLNLTRRSIVVLLAGTATVYHRVTLQPVLVQQPQPVPTVTHHHRLFFVAKAANNTGMRTCR